MQVHLQLHRRSGNRFFNWYIEFNLTVYQQASSACHRAVDEFSIGGSLSLTKFHQFVKTERLFNLEKRHKMWYLTDDPSKVEELSNRLNEFVVMIVHDSFEQYHRLQVFCFVLFCFVLFCFVCIQIIIII